MGKFSFLAVAALGYGLIVSQPCTLKAHHFNVTPQALYNSYNELYFNNELPKDVEVVAEEVPDYGDGKIRLGGTSHSLGNHYYKIYVSPKYNAYQQDEQETVIHEMAHVYVWEQAEKGKYAYDGEHGPEWQAEMLNLASKGAFKDLW